MQRKQRVGPYVGRTYRIKLAQIVALILVLSFCWYNHLLARYWLRPIFLLTRRGSIVRKHQWIGTNTSYAPRWSAMHAGDRTAWCQIHLRRQSVTNRRRKSRFALNSHVPVVIICSWAEHMARFWSMCLGFNTFYTAAFAALKFTDWTWTFRRHLGVRKIWCIGPILLRVNLLTKLYQICSQCYDVERL